MNEPFCLTITCFTLHFPITLVNVNKSTAKRYLKIRLEIDINSEFLYFKSELHFYIFFKNTWQATKSCWNLQVSSYNFDHGCIKPEFATNNYSANRPITLCIKGHVSEHKAWSAFCSVFFTVYFYTLDKILKESLTKAYWSSHI